VRRGVGRAAAPRFQKSICIKITTLGTRDWCGLD